MTLAISGVKPTSIKCAGTDLTKVYIQVAGVKTLIWEKPTDLNGLVVSLWMNNMKATIGRNSAGRYSASTSLWSFTTGLPSSFTISSDSHTLSDMANTSSTPSVSGYSKVVISGEAGSIPYSTLTLSDNTTVRRQVSARFVWESGIWHIEFYNSNTNWNNVKSLEFTGGTYSNCAVTTS